MACIYYVLIVKETAMLCFVLSLFSTCNNRCTMSEQTTHPDQSAKSLTLPLFPGIPSLSSHLNEPHIFPFYLNTLYYTTTTIIRNQNKPFHTHSVHLMCFFPREFSFYKIWYCIKTTTFILHRSLISILCIFHRHPIHKIRLCCSISVSMWYHRRRRWYSELPKQVVLGYCLFSVMHNTKSAIFQGLHAIGYKFDDQKLNSLFISMENCKNLQGRHKSKIVKYTSFNV